MKITIEFDNLAEADAALKAIGVSGTGASAKKAAPAKKAPKPVKDDAKVTDSPDKEPEPVQETETFSDDEQTETSYTLADDAPPEIKKLCAGPASKDLISKAVLATSKTKGRQVAVDILEQFRPKGNTKDVVGVSDIDTERYGELSDLICQVFSA